MSKAAKFIIVLLAVLFLASLLLALQSSNTKEMTVREYQNKEAELRKTYDSLSQQLSTAQEEKRRLEVKMDAMQKDLAKITSERDDWKNKYDTAVKEKEGLMTKLKEIPSATAVSREVTAAAPPVTPDEYWAGVLKDKAALELQIKGLHDELNKTQLQVEEFKKTKTEMELELSKLKQIQGDFERKIKYSSDLADALSLELAQDKNDKRFILEKMAGIKDENAKLRAQVKELSTTKFSLQKSLQKLMQDKRDLEVQLTKTEQIIQSRVNDMVQIKNEIEAATQERNVSGIEGKTVQLPPIIVKAQGTPQKEAVTSTAPTYPAASVRVISINEPNNFVIINAGENAGIKVGDAFKVYRDGKEIALIEVIQTRSDISAADIKQKTQNIQVGDSVK